MKGIVKCCFIGVFILLKMVMLSQNLTDKQLLLRDSLKARLKADSIHIYRFQRLRPYVNLDQRNSFVRKAPINVNGIQLGVLINERHAVGLGGYIITGDSKQKVRTKTDKNITVDRKLDMSYFTIFYQCDLVDKRFFEFDVQVESGVGKYDLQFYDIQTGKLIKELSAGVLVEGLGPQLTIKPLQWIGFNAMVGYRFTFEKNANLNFDGTYYSYGVWLDIRQIIRDCNYYFIKKPKYHKLLNQSM